MDRFQLSVRSYTRILKLARTIADLKGLEQIGLSEVTEALSFRSLDKPITLPAKKYTAQNPRHAFS